MITIPKPNLYTILATDLWAVARRSATSEGRLNSEANIRQLAAAIEAIVQAQNSTLDSAASVAQLKSRNEKLVASNAELLRAAVDQGRELHECRETKRNLQDNLRRLKNRKTASEMNPRDQVAEETQS